MTFMEIILIILTINLLVNLSVLVCVTTKKKHICGYKPKPETDIDNLLPQMERMAKRLTEIEDLEISHEAKEFVEEILNRKEVCVDEMLDKTTQPNPHPAYLDIPEPSSVDSRFEELLKLENYRVYQGTGFTIDQLRQVHSCAEKDFILDTFADYDSLRCEVERICQQEFFSLNRIHKIASILEVEPQTVKSFIKKRQEANNFPQMDSLKRYYKALEVT